MLESPSWKTWVQDFGPPENPQLHETLFGKNSPKGLYLNTKTRSHPKASKLQCQMPHAMPHAFALQQNRNITLPVSRQAAKSHTKPRDTPNTLLDKTLPFRDKIQFHPPDHMYKSPQSGNLHKALVQCHPLGEGSTNRNYDLPACRKETPNTANYTN